jgi:hypothetical protein
LVWWLQRRLPQATIVVGFWTLTAQEVVDRDALAATPVDSVVTSLSQAVEQAVNATGLAAGGNLVEVDPHASAAAPD